MLSEHDSKLIFLDTETTGREEKDRIFQVAYSLNGEMKCQMFKPPVPLEIEAMEATGYTNKDVEDKPSFQSTEFYTTLKKILENNNYVLVAHNARFDIEMLKKEDITPERYIDTMRVSQHLDAEGKLGAYRLQYLRYKLELEIEEARAHDAMGDVIVLIALFKRLFDKMSEKISSAEEIIHEMERLSKTPVEIKTFTFGKHINKSVAQVAQEAPDYLEWLLRQKKEEINGNTSVSANAEDWIYTLEKYLRK